MSLSRRTWIALGAAFLVIVLLLALTAVALISQRQRTVLLNKQLGSLLGEATVVLKRAEPVLDAIPAQKSTVASRAQSAADLVAQARPMIEALRASNLPGVVSAANQLLASIDQPGALEHTLSNVDSLATQANQAAIVPGLVRLLDEVPAASNLISQATSLTSAARRVNLLGQVRDGLNDLDTIVRLQRHTLEVQTATLEDGRQTRQLTAQTLATAKQTLTATLQILAVAQQTLAHTENIDRKVP